MNNLREGAGDKMTTKEIFATMKPKSLAG